MARQQRPSRWVVAFGCAALLAGVVGPDAHAAREQVLRTGSLDFSCEYPLIGMGALTLAASTLGPRAIPSGKRAALKDVRVTATIPEDIAQDLYAAAGVDGLRGDIDVGLAASGGTLDSEEIRDVALTEHFYTSGEFRLSAAQDAQTSVPDVTAGQAPGPLLLGLADTMTMRLDLHLVNSDPDWEQQPAFTCHLDPGQDPKLGEISIDRTTAG